MTAQYQETTFSVTKTDLCKWRDAMDAAREHVTEVLAEHDRTLGRTTRKNKAWAEQLDNDLRQITEAHTQMQERIEV